MSKAVKEENNTAPIYFNLLLEVLLRKINLINKNFITYQIQVIEYVDDNNKKFKIETSKNNEETRQKGKEERF